MASFYFLILSISFPFIISFFAERRLYFIFTIIDSLKKQQFILE